jgi:hypothetical protein
MRLRAASDFYLFYLTAGRLWGFQLKCIPSLYLELARFLIVADEFQEGMKLFQKQQYKEALVHFKKAAEEDSNNPKTWNAMGAACSKLGYYDVADECYDNALMLDPGNTTYEANRKKNNDLLVNKPQPAKIQPQKQQISTEYPEKEKGARADVSWSKPYERNNILIGLFFSFFIGLFVYAATPPVGVMLLIFIVITSAILVYKDAQAIGGQGMFSPAILAILVILFWLIALPVYLLMRKGIYEKASTSGFQSGSRTPAPSPVIIIGVIGGVIVLSMIVAAFVFGMAGNGQSSTIPANVQLPKTPLSTNNTAVSSSGVTPQPTISQSKQSLSDFSSITHGSLFVVGKNWNADAQNDGVVVYPDLKNDADKTVEWSNAELPVEIQIWTTKIDSKFKEVKDQMIYKGTGNILSWRDGNMFLNGGIRIPFAEIATPQDKSYGTTLVKVSLPDGRVIESEFPFTPLKAT